MNFADILKKGKSRFKSKNKKIGWGVCESCGIRKLLFEHVDSCNAKWIMCEDCINVFVKADKT